VTDLKMDPEELVKTTHAKHYEILAYTEQTGGTDEDGNECVVGTLVYRSSFEPLDSPVAHVDTRVAVFSTLRGPWALYDSGLHSMWNDYAAYDKADKDRRAAEKVKNPPPPEPKMIEDAEVVEDAWECDSCGHVYGEDDKGDPTYECSTCGTSGAGEDARRCSSCGAASAARRRRARARRAGATRTCSTRRRRATCGRAGPGAAWGPWPTSAAGCVARSARSR
jgi:hypothetical protein